MSSTPFTPSQQPQRLPERRLVPRIMPLVPKNLDWVRVAQRFPVRIRLLDPPENLMRAGASITVTVHHGTRC